MPSAFTLPSRLYAILDIDLTRARGLEPLAVCEAWLDAGVRLIQIRAKTIGSGEFLDLADACAQRTRAAGATFVVNDRADIAAMAHADGVHVGQDDLPARAARTLVGPDAIVGLSTHSDAQLDAGCAEPVSYLAIGPVYSTSTKRSTNATVGLEGVTRAAARARGATRPLVAIGGITMSEAPSVIEAGADAVAVISDLLDADIGARARRYLKALEGLPL